MEMYPGEPTAEQVFLALHTGGGEADGPSFDKLRQSILTSGTVIQPVILNAGDSGNLVCIDGNTRVALYREFDQRGAEGDWQSVPAIVYDKLDDREVDAIRLQAHLVGPRQWDPYSKAKYLDYLRHREHIPYSELVDFCGGSKKMVTESIDAYNDMEQYYRPLLSDDSEFDVRRFSGFVELQKPGVKEAILGAGFNLGDFSQWLVDRKIGPLREVRLLIKILKSTKARDIFLTDGASEAAKVLEATDVSKALRDAPMAELCRALSATCDHIEFKDVQKMRDDPTSVTALAVSEAHESLAELVKWISGND